MAHGELICPFHPHVSGFSFGFGESEDVAEEWAREERGRDAGGTPVEATSFSDDVLFFSTVSGADECYWDSELREFRHDLLDCQCNWIFHHPRSVRTRFTQQGRYPSIETFQLRICSSRT